MDDLRKQLDLDNKYSDAKKRIKRAREKAKGIKIKPIAIIVPIIAIILINMAMGGLFEKEIIENKQINLPEPNSVEVVLDNNLDPDTDGITTKEEIELGTNPFNRDTDNDGVTDDGEIALGLNPLEENKNIIIDAYNGINGNKYDLPVNYLQFILRADSLKSRAYLTATNDALPTSMQEFTFNFTGTVEGNGYYKRKDGFFEKGKKGKSDGELKVRVSTLPETMKKIDSVDITTLKVFGKNIPIENILLRGLLNFFLPKHGAIAAFDNLKSDYSPNSLRMNNSFNATNIEFAKEAIENLSDSRFNLLHNDVSYKDRLQNRLQAGEIVPASIISGDKEYLIFITGQYENGNFLAMDPKTNKEIGEMVIEKIAKPMTDGQNLVQIETLRFELGELGSEKGDRLIFL